MESQLSLSDLSVELLFTIFKKLDRPSKLCLALSSPKMLHLLAKYYDLDRYRAESLFNHRFGVPDSVSWQEPKAQGAILRWISMRGYDDIDDPGYDIFDEQETASLDIDFSILRPYDESDEVKEDVVVQKIFGEWLRERCGIEGGVVFCAECYRFMRLRSANGEKEPWGTRMSEVYTWSRRCGLCEDS